MTSHRTFSLTVFLLCFVVGTAQGWAQLHPRAGANRPVEFRMADSFESVDVQETTAYTDQWAIIIGVDQYQTSGSDLKDLEFAVNDAREFKELLVNEFGYQEDHIAYLADRDATGQSVVNAFAKWLPEQQPKSTDSVLVFFAGHGLIEPETKDGFLACVDSREANIQGTCLAIAWVRKQLSQLPCKHKLVILDSCFSGILFRGQDELPSPSSASNANLSLVAGATSGRSGQRQSFSTGNSESQPADNFTYYLENSAFFGMTAGRETPVADGLGANKHSVFTAALLRVMRERADSPRDDHAFTFRQLAASVERLVTSSAGSEQIPDWRRLEDGQGDFVFRPQFRRKTPSELSHERYIKSEWRLYAIQIASAKQAWENGNVAKAWTLYNECRWDFRGWEHDYLHALMNRNQKTIHEVGATSVCFSPDGTQFVSGSWDGTVRIWDANNGRQSSVFNARCHVTDVDYSSDGKWIASGGRDGTIQIWDTDSGEIVSTFEEEKSRAVNIRFSPDDSLLASTLTETLTIWDVGNARKIESFQSNVKFVHCLDFSPDGKQLMIGSQGGDIQVFDVSRLLSETPESGLDSPPSSTILRSDRVNSFAKTGGVYSIRFSLDGKRLLSSSVDGRVELWTFPAAVKLLSIDAAGTRDVDFNADGSQIIGVDEAGRVHVWNALDGQEILTLKGDSNGARCVAASPRDGRIVSAGSSINLWDINSAQIASEVKPHDGRVLALAISPDGKRMVTSGLDKKVIVWDAQTVKQITSFATEFYVNDIAFSPDGIQFVTGGGAIKGLIDRVSCSELRTWDTESGQLLKEFVGNSNRIKSVAYSPDGRKIVSGDVEKEVKLWDVETGEELLSISLPDRPDGFRNDDGCYDHVTISPDGKTIISVDDCEIRSWDSENGREQIVLAGHRDKVRCVAYSPDSSRVVSGSKEGAVKIWNAASGRELMSLNGHDTPIVSVSFSADGRRILSGGEDDNIKLWDAETGQETLTLQYKNVARTEFSPDGCSIVAGNEEGDIKMWKISPSRSGLTLSSRGRVRLAVDAHFSPDGNQIVCGWFDGSITVWNALTGIQQLELYDRGITYGHVNVAITPDSKQIVASTGEGEIKYWDAQSGRVVQYAKLENLEKLEGMYKFAVSPDGKKVVGASTQSGADGVGIAVWDARTGESLLEIEKDELAAVVVFDRSGSRIAVGKSGGGRLRSGIL